MHMKYKGELCDVNQPIENFNSIKKERINNYKINEFSKIKNVLKGRYVIFGYII